MDAGFLRAMRAWIGPVLACGLVAGCGQDAAPDDAPASAPPVARVAPAGEAIAGAHLPMLDPATLDWAEIRRVIGSRPPCIFRYTSTGRPVLAAGLGPGGRPEIGVAKLNGILVPLQPEGAAQSAIALADEPVRLRVRPLGPQAAGLPPAGGPQVEADMVFEIGSALTVGYGGWLECGREPAPVKRP